MARHPMRPRGNFRTDRQLHEFQIAQRPVDQPQFERMNHVLAVMQHNALETKALPLLIQTHGFVNAVEAVRLGGRALPVMNDDAQSRVAAAQGCNGSHRLGIIAVTADIENIFARLPAVQHIGDGPANHIGFAPAGNKYRETPIQTISRQIVHWQVVGKMRPMITRPKAQAEPDGIHRQFVRQSYHEPEYHPAQQSTTTRHPSAGLLVYHNLHMRPSFTKLSRFVQNHLPQQEVLAGPACRSAFWAPLPPSQFIAGPDGHRPDGGLLLQRRTGGEAGGPDRQSGPCAAKALAGAGRAGGHGGACGHLPADRAASGHAAARLGDPFGNGHCLCHGRHRLAGTAGAALPAPVPADCGGGGR
ncbi:hypothetical protein E4T56_gene6827, partial [Termitomyces sp. T112]